ncbi:hypothetical protein [Pseudomonas putida]
MKPLKIIASCSLLLGLMGTAYAEGGYEQAKQFNENFRTEQARLWNDDSFEQDKQQVALEQQKKRQNSHEKTDN